LSYVAATPKSNKKKTKEKVQSRKLFDSRFWFPHGDAASLLNFFQPLGSRELIFLSNKNLASKKYNERNNPAVCNE